MFGTSIALALALATGSTSAKVEPAKATLTEAQEAYRWFHAHPELSGKERQTAAHMAGALRAIGLEVHEGIGGHGIVGILRGKKGGPVVLYRADMDGLPVTEATGLGYASKNKGVMHACGHDIHMATAVGVLRTLKNTSDRWSGTVLFVGQPAEEIGRGAKDMLADQKFKKLLARIGKPKIAFALHDAADLPAGDVSILPGFHHANVDSVDIVVNGKGGHGARPHETIDPIVIASEIVMSLQTIVSRRIRPDEKAVVTVGKFVAGTKNNIIPPQALLGLTVRSYSDATRSTLLGEIERIARQIAKAHRAPRAPEVRVSTRHVPAAFNDPKWTERIRARFVAELGEAHVKKHQPSLGGEDFGLFAKQLRIPGIMWKLGAVNPGRWRRTRGKGLPGLHSDHFSPDPAPTLKTGIQTVTAAILEGLAQD